MEPVIRVSKRCFQPCRIPHSHFFYPFVSEATPHVEMPYMPNATRRATIALLILLALFLSAWFLLPPVYRADKLRRGRNAAAAARAEMKLENWEGASRQVRLALSLAPTDPEILRTVATVCSRVGNPAALQYWQALHETGKATSEDQLAYARTLLSLDHPADARPILAQLLTENPRHFEALELSIQTFVLEKRFANALVAARTLADLYPGDDRAHASLGQMLLAQPGQDSQAQGETVLWSLALRSNPYRLQSIAALATRPQISTNQLRLLAYNIPDVAGLPGCLLRLDIERRLKPDSDPQAFATQALACRPATPSIDQDIHLADWFYRYGLNQNALDLLPEAICRTNGPALQRRLQGFANTGQWGEVTRCVEDKTLPIDVVLRNIYRAIIAHRNGSEEGVVVHLNTAANAVGLDPAQARLVAGYAEALNQPRIAAESLQRLLSNPSYAAATGPQIFRLLSRVDDVGPLLEAIERMLQFDPRNPFLINDRAWWRLVTGQRIAESRQQVLDLLQTDPASPRFIASLALSHLRDNNADQALALTEPIMLSSTNPLPRLRLVYCAALGKAGQREAARRIGRELDPARLRSAERLLVTDWLTATNSL